jgi:hypothetical protein
MPLASDTTAADVLMSLDALGKPAPADHETLLRVLDIARGYPMRQLIGLSRILPAVQPRIDPALDAELAPMFHKAQEMIQTWQASRVGSRVFSAEEETAMLLDLYRRERTAPSALSSVHSSLLGWLTDHEPGATTSDLWQEAWNVSQVFNASKKAWILSFLGDLDAHGLIGDSILDVGAGRAAVSDQLQSADRRIIQLDCAAAEQKEHVLLLQVDIEDEASVEGAMDAIRAHIGAETVQTVLCSHVLNYVDFRRVIAAYGRLLSAGGRMVIFNQPFEGESEAFSARGVRDNYELLDFLTEEGYAIEYLQAAPLVHVSDYDADLRAKSLLTVARKPPL